MTGQLNKYGGHSLRLRSFKMDRYNICNASMSLGAFVNNPNSVSEALGYLFPAPAFQLGSGYLPCTGAEIEWEKGSAYAVFYYEGLYPGAAIGEQYGELIGSDQQEPIETHPHFDQIGPKYGAQYDATTGQFTGFPRMLNGSLNPLFGVTEYLTIGMVWQQTSTLAQAPTTEQVETIGPPPGFISQGNYISPPPLSGSRTWLQKAPQLRWRGNIWQYTQTWQASGRSGWNSDIYST